jgi:hypothetical protein
MGIRTTHADALHQAGRTQQALVLFQAAERLQTEHQPDDPRLYSLWGFRYCDLLLAQAGEDALGIGEVMERAEYAIKISERYLWLLDVALNQLTLAHAHLQPALHPSTSGTTPGMEEVGRSRESEPRGARGAGEHITQAADWLEKAVASLRAAGQNDYLPRGLLTRATLHRLTRNYPLAQQDLQEVHDIAEPSGMRLHLTDYHLEAAQLAHAMGEPQATIQRHLQAAAELIQQTGYHWRDGELAELQKQLENHPE